MNKTKKCNKCGKNKPLTSDFFYKHNTTKDGFRPDCKECSKDYYKKYYKNNKKIITMNQIRYGRHRDMEFKEKYGYTYQAIHRFIKRNKYEPDICDICNKKRKLELASINHTYTRNVDDWMYLCKECHKKIDGSLE